MNFKAKTNKKAYEHFMFCAFLCSHNEKANENTVFWCYSLLLGGCCNQILASSSVAKHRNSIWQRCRPCIDAEILDE